jgi:hypothetical protein
VHPYRGYGHPMVGPGAKAWQFISGNSGNPMVELGWKSVGVLAEAEQRAAGISGPAYAMDDETAIKVVDGTVEVVSEGQCKALSFLAADTNHERGGASHTAMKHAVGVVHRLPPRASPTCAGVDIDLADQASQ